MSQLSEILEPLTDQERIFVENMLKGTSQIAAATAAGYSKPQQRAYQIAKRPKIAEILAQARGVFADEVDFTRRKAHDMLMDAYRSAENTIEQVTAVRELIKLHGIAAVEKKQIVHTHEGQIGLNGMTDHQLAKLAGYDETLVGEYYEVEDAECLPAPNAG